MHETVRDDPKRRVRYLLRQFFSDQLTRRAARRELIQQISSLGGEFVIFGGVLRDLIHRGSGYLDVHDVDIVYDGIDEAELIGSLKGCESRKNRFGGWKVEREGHVFDIWRLQDTWAFRSFPNGPWSGKLQDLVLTTQLSVEAIIVYVKRSSNMGREVITAPIFDESLAQRCVELNFEPNPDPTGSVVRALVTADRLQYCVGPRLARYITRVMAESDQSRFVDYLSHRYPEGEMSAEGLLSRLKMISRHVEGGHMDAVRLPIAGQQMLF